MSSGSQKNAGAELEDMDSLRLPCATPWGAPPPGVLFTPAAFARYSVSIQRADQQVWDAQPSASPLPHMPDAAAESDGNGGGSMEALSGYASPGAVLQDSYSDMEPEPASAIGGKALSPAAQHPAGRPCQPLAAPLTTAQQRQAAAHARVARASGKGGPGACRKAAGTVAKQQRASAARSPRSKKRKAADQAAGDDDGAAPVPEIITSDEPAAAVPPATTADGSAAAAPAGTGHKRQRSGGAPADMEQQGAGKASAKQQRKQRAQQQRWSSLTAEDHQWFLERQGKELRGQEAQIFAVLAEHVAQERAAVLALQWEAAAAHPERYHFVARRALQQMEADNAQRRARVRSYPRLYRLYQVVLLPDPNMRQNGTAAAADGEDGGGGEEAADSPDMWHLQQLGRLPSELELALPRCPTRIPLDVPYLPSEVEIGPQAAPKAAPAAAAATASPKSQQAADVGDASKGKASIAAVKKVPAPEVSRDHNLAAVVASAAAEGDTGGAVDVAMAASTFETLVATLPHDLSLGWEIPVRIGPQDPGGTASSGEGAEVGAQQQGDDSSAAGRCIFLDKPLLRRELSPRERHERLYKHALLSVALRSAQNAAAAAFGAPVRIASRAAPAAASRPAPAGTSVAAVATAGGSPMAADAELRAQQVPGLHEEPVSSAGAEAAGAAAAGATAQPATDGSSLGDGAAGDVHASAAAADDNAAQCPGLSSQIRHEDGLIVTTRRGCAHDLWQLGRFRIIVRSHETAVLRDPARPALLLRAKMEYIPKQGLEAVTAGEAARRWAALQLRPDAALLVGRVATETSELLRVELLRLADVLAQCEETEFRPAYAYRLVAALLEALSAAKPGRYLLAHMPHADNVTCFQALPPDLDLPQVRAQPLPCANAQPGAIYDLHAAHVNSGATDEATLPFVPPQWRPFNEHVPQIPGTFPVRVRGAPKPGPRGADEATKEQRRMRKLLPSAWARLGIGGDWDTTAAGSGSIGGGSNVAAYAKALEEGAEEI